MLGYNDIIGRKNLLIELRVESKTYCIGLRISNKYLTPCNIFSKHPFSVSFKQSAHAMFHGLLLRTVSVRSDGFHVHEQCLPVGVVNTKIHVAKTYRRMRGYRISQDSYVIRRWKIAFWTHTSLRELKKKKNR